MYNLDKKMGNSDLLGRYFWRIETKDEKGALEKCITWASFQKDLDFTFWYYQNIRPDRRMACPCTLRQAFLDTGRYHWDWRFSWPKRCFRSNRFIESNVQGFVQFKVFQLCCYSTEPNDYGALIFGIPRGGHLIVTLYKIPPSVDAMFTDFEAYKFCCVDESLCHLFYLYRPSDDCQFYRPPPRRKFFDARIFQTAFNQLIPHKLRKRTFNTHCFNSLY